MTTITNLKHKTSEQHIDLGSSGSKRDYVDLRQIQEWFNQFEPCNPNQCSLSSGLTAADDDGVNCDRIHWEKNSEEAGQGECCRSINLEN
jgi:hypothetical protein